MNKIINPIHSVPIHIIFNFDEFDGKTVCLECKYSEFNFPFGWECQKEKEKILNYLRGEINENYPSCVSKNTDGTCDDYMPLELSARLDFLIEKGRKRLTQDIDDIFRTLRFESYTQRMVCNFNSFGSDEVEIDIMRGNRDGYDR